MENIMKLLVLNLLEAIDYNCLSEMIFGEWKSDAEVVAYLNDFETYFKMIKEVGNCVYDFVCENIHTGHGLDKGYLKEALGKIDWEAVAEGIIEKWCNTSTDCPNECKWYN
jgi:hypothetical protein